MSIKNWSQSTSLWSRKCNTAWKQSPWLNWAKKLLLISLLAPTCLRSCQETFRGSNLLSSAWLPSAWSIAKKDRSTFSWTAAASQRTKRSLRLTSALWWIKTQVSLTASFLYCWVLKLLKICHWPMMSPWLRTMRRSLTWWRSLELAWPSSPLLYKASKEPTVTISKVKRRTQLKSRRW